MKKRVGAVLMIHRRQRIVLDAEVGPSKQPKVIWQTWVQPGWIVITFAPCRLGKKRVVDERTIGAPLDLAPIAVLHHDHPDGPNAINPAAAVARHARRQIGAA